MNYSRKTLISEWHKNRKEEPKDYEITACRDGQRKLHKSSYKHFGTHLGAIQARDMMDKKMDFRRHSSQFTDLTDHRRLGRYTWPDFNDVQTVVQKAANSLYRQIDLSSL